MSATADRPRRHHLRVIPGRGLAEQIAIAVAHEMELYREAIERDPANIRRVLLTIEVAHGLVVRTSTAIELADSTAMTGTG